MTKHLTPEEQQVIADEEEAERVYQTELAAANEKLNAARAAKAAKAAKSIEPEPKPRPDPEPEPDPEPDPEPETKRDQKITPKAALDEPALATRLAAEGITIVRSTQAVDGNHLYVIDHGRDRWYPIPNGTTTDGAFTLITGKAATKDVDPDQPELDPNHKHRIKKNDNAPEPTPAA